MQAIGNDGKWHEWSELSAEEQAEWMRCMSMADRRREEEYKTGRWQTWQESLRDYYEKRRLGMV